MGYSDTASVQVTVRHPLAQALALPDPADRTGATGDIVDTLPSPAATGGRGPYTYAFSALPEELGAIGRRIRGRLVTPGVSTVSVTVTDANGDTATQTFSWTVTGNAIVPPAGINVRIDWGAAFFSRAEANVTDRIKSGITCYRGRTTSSAILGGTAAGKLSFELDNSDGLYDDENVQSSLNGLVRAGITVQLRDGGDILWTGVLDSIPTRYDDTLARQHRAVVTALGIYSTLREAELSVGSVDPTTTAQAFCESPRSGGYLWSGAG